MTTDANDKPKDAIPAGQDSEGKGQKDLAQLKVYTEDEAESKFSQQRSVLDKKITGLEKQVKSYQGLETEVSTLKDRITQKEQEAEERDLKSIGDDQDALREWRERKSAREDRAKLTQERTDFDRDKAEHKEELEDYRKSKSEKDAQEVADRLGVDVQPILKFLKKVPDASPEDIGEFAETLSKKTEDKPPLKTDSSTTIGGGQMPDTAKGKIRAGWDELHK